MERGVIVRAAAAGFHIVEPIPLVEVGRTLPAIGEGPGLPLVGPVVRLEPVRLAEMRHRGSVPAGTEQVAAELEMGGRESGLPRPVSYSCGALAGSQDEAACGMSQAYGNRTACPVSPADVRK